MAAIPAQKAGKRLIVACDGTWASSDSGFDKGKGKLAIPTNVTKICRAVLPKKDESSKEQVVYYQSGLGSENNWYSYIVGGYLGEGIGENIREAYSFLATNYVEGDEIFLIGFSRGAFTARSIGGLIASIGLLTRKGLSDFYPIFLDWENQYNDDFVNPWRPRCFDPKYKFSDPAYLEQLVKLELTRPTVPIKAIAVWDTVGSLGVPDMWFLPKKTKKEYSFIDTEVGHNVENAYQALALDENRTPFSPTVWECPKAGTKTSLLELKQCWFPGVHSNIGGSYPDAGLADISLAWLMTQLSKLIDFDQKFIEYQQTLNIQWYKDQPTSDPKWPKGKPAVERPWSLGKLYQSDGFIDKWATGLTTRTPGQYYRTDPATGQPTKELLRDTQEFIHPSVRVRKTVPEAEWKAVGITGLGKNDASGVYDPDALKSKLGWEVYWPGQEWRGAGPKPWPNEHDDWIKWVRTEKGQDPVYICEDRIEDSDLFQMGLLEDWPDELKIVRQTSPRP